MSMRRSCFRGDNAVTERRLIDEDQDPTGRECFPRRGTRSSSRFGPRLAIGLLKLFALLPYGFVARLGDGLGWLLYQIPSRRRRIVHTNLKLCFPEWSDERREDVDDAGVAEGVYGPRFVEETLDDFLVRRKLGKEQLQGHPSTNLGLVGLVDRAHTTPPDKSDDLVLPERLADHAESPSIF